MKLSDFFSQFFKPLQIGQSRSRRNGPHIPGFTKRPKRSKRNRNRVRNRIARLSRRVNRRRSA
jgi:hypothetical protein